MTTIETKIAKNGTKMYFRVDENGKKTRVAYKDIIIDYAFQVREQHKAKVAAKLAEENEVVDDYAVSPEAQDVAVEAEIEAAAETKKETATTVVKKFVEEVSEHDAKFEIGKTYFVMDFLNHTTQTITVEARTAHMLTGTTAEGTRKYHVGENVKGEFVQLGKDDDGYGIYVYAYHEFTPANVEDCKQAAINLAAKLGVHSEPDPEDYAISEEAFKVAVEAEIEQANQTATAELPKGSIEVDNGADAFKLVAPYFPNGLIFDRAYKFIHDEDIFNFTDPAKRFCAVVSSDCHNRRIEMIEVHDHASFGSKAKPLTVKINLPNAPKFVATQITFPNGYEGEPTREVSKTFDNLDDAAKFIADDYPIIEVGGHLQAAYHDGFFGGVFFAGWRIEQNGKELANVDYLGNAHGDQSTVDLVNKYIDANDEFIIPNVPGFLAPEAQALNLTKKKKQL